MIRKLKTNSEAGFVCLMVLMVLLFSNSSLAQRFEGGLLGGFNASQVDGDHITGYNKPGVIFGGYVKTDLSRSVYFGAELKYAQKGSRKNPDPKTDDQLKYIMRLGYIDVPVYIGFRTSDVISIYTGLSGGYLMHAKEFDSYGEIPEIEKRPFKDFDFQALLGFRFDFTERISIDIRGTYSFLPIRELPGSSVFYVLDDEYNNVLTTAVYYRLDF